LFSRKEQAARAPKIGTFYWLAPSAIAMLFMLSLLKAQINPAAVQGGEPMVAMIVSNRSGAAYLSRSSQVEHNELRNTFAWTNRSVSNSSIGFTPFGKLND
jgi:hypothetical protein